MTRSAGIRRATHDAATIARLLEAVHGQWLGETHTALDPAATPRSNLWDRWTAARYLGDQFELQFARERELIELLRPHLRKADAKSLLAGAAQLDAVRGQLSALGRGKNAAAEMAEITRSFLALLERWCRQLEGAAARLRRAELSAAARETLDKLAAGAGVRA